MCGKYFRNRFASLAKYLAAVVACTVVSAAFVPTIANAQIVALDDLFNELNGPTESIYRILNERTCISPSEAANLLYETESLLNQWKKD